MALIDLWSSSRSYLEDKHVQQVMAFAGDGKLVDGGLASDEFRAFLQQVPSELLTRYGVPLLLSGVMRHAGVLDPGSPES